MKETRKIVCHLGKIKKGQLTPLQIHHQREKPSRTNPDIDESRKRMNYDLHNKRPIKFQKRAKEIIEKYAPKARLRKDSVYVIEADISAGRKFWETATPQEQKRFFKEAYEFMCKKVGRQNVVYATVHMDEKSPHMHFGFCPITKDGRLNAKDALMNRGDMGRIHKELYEHLRSKGLEVEQGEPAKEKHIQPQRWKLQQLRKELDQTQKVLDKLTRVGQKVKPVAEMQAEPVLFGRDRVKVLRSDWEALKSQAVEAIRLRADNEKLQNENIQLKKHLIHKNEREEQLKDEIGLLRSFIRRYEREFEKYQKQRQRDRDRNRTRMIDLGEF